MHNLTCHLQSQSNWIGSAFNSCERSFWKQGRERKSTSFNRFSVIALPIIQRRDPEFHPPSLKNRRKKSQLVTYPEMINVSPPEMWWQFLNTGLLMTNLKNLTTPPCTSSTKEASSLRNESNLNGQTIPHYLNCGLKVKAHYRDGYSVPLYS